MQRHMQESFSLILNDFFLFMSYKKAQAALEFAAVFSFTLILLMAVLYFFHTYSTSSGEEISYTQLNIIGNDIVSAAESVYYMGYPAKLTLDINMPTGVYNATIVRDWSIGLNELEFQLENGQNLSFFSEVNLNGTFTLASASQGAKRVVLEMRDENPDFVHITINRFSPKNLLLLLLLTNCMKNS